MLLPYWFLSPFLHLFPSPSSLKILFSFTSLLFNYYLIFIHIPTYPCLLVLILMLSQSLSSYSFPIIFLQPYPYFHPTWLFSSSSSFLSLLSSQYLFSFVFSFLFSSSFSFHPRSYVYWHRYFHPKTDCHRHSNSHSHCHPKAEVIRATNYFNMCRNWQCQCCVVSWSQCWTYYYPLVQLVEQHISML